MAQLTTDNINTIAAATASMGDDDYLYIYKADGQAMGRITKAQLLQGIRQSSGGMSAAIYLAIKTNVEVLRLNFNALSSALANLAFSGDNPNLSIGEFNWPEQESGGGGDTPTPTDEPTITFKNGSGNTITTLNVGEIAEGESSVSNTFFVYGTNLTDDITLSVTNGRFDVLPTTIPMNNASSGVQVTITYSGNSSLATDYVVASSNGATSKTLIATATKDEGQHGGDEPTPSQSIELVQGKYIGNGGSSPHSPNNPNNEICCMNALLAVDFSDITTEDWANAYIDWVHGGVNSYCAISFCLANGSVRNSVLSTNTTNNPTTNNTYSVVNTGNEPSNWASRRTEIKNIVATFKYDTTTQKVAAGCEVKLHYGNNQERVLISSTDLQNATFVTG